MSGSEVPGSRSELRVAIVGCGAISRAHRAAIAGLEGVCVALMIDPDPDVLVEVANEANVAGFSSVSEALAAASFDAACVCSPPASHRALVEELLEAGVDVLCEKPLATSSVDARAMFDLARDSGRRLCVSDKFRHVSDLVEAGRLVASGRIGRPLRYGVSFCAPVDTAGRWPSNPGLSGGGVLMDNGPHAFDVLSHVLQSEIREIYGTFGDARTPALPVEETACLLLETTDGAIGIVELSWSYFTPDLDYLVVQGSEGTLRVGWTGGAWRRHGGREWQSFGSGYDKGDAFRGVWEGFLGRGPEAASPPDPVAGLELIERAYASRTR